MSKVKLRILILKAKKVFQELETSASLSDPKGKKTILTGEGLTRQELRQLERHGLVKKMSVYREKKYAENPATMEYIWEWIGD